MTGLMIKSCFRAVLFRMVPKPDAVNAINSVRFRAVLFRMVPKHISDDDLPF